MEIRSAWKKNIMNFDAHDISEVLTVVKKNNLQVTDIGSPLFKVDWPDAPKSKFAEKDQFNANFTYAQQDEILDRCIELAKKLSTDRIRCFDFWRLDDPAPHRSRSLLRSEHANAQADGDVHAPRVPLGLRVDAAVLDR